MIIDPSETIQSGLKSKWTHDYPFVRKTRGQSARIWASDAGIIVVPDVRHRSLESFASDDIPKGYVAFRCAAIIVATKIIDPPPAEVSTI